MPLHDRASGRPKRDYLVVRMKNPTKECARNASRANKQVLKCLVMYGGETISVQLKVLIRGAAFQRNVLVGLNLMNLNILKRQVRKTLL